MIKNPIILIKNLDDIEMLIKTKKIYIDGLLNHAKQIMAKRVCNYEINSSIKSILEPQEGDIVYRIDFERDEQVKRNDEYDKTIAEFIYIKESGDVRFITYKPEI
jgi:hypothetical protein